VSCRAAIADVERLTGIVAAALERGALDDAVAAAADRERIARAIDVSTLTPDEVAPARQTLTDVIASSRALAQAVAETRTLVGDEFRSQKMTVQLNRKYDGA